MRARPLPRLLPVTPRSNCGSGLAREGGLTVNHHLPVTPRSKNVGAGLLAKAS